MSNKSRTFAPAKPKGGAEIFKMVPIVQLVRASDCGSECRRFESVWAPLGNLSSEVPFFLVR